MLADLDRLAMFQINVLFRVMKINDLLGSKQRRELRKIAHHLRPVVTIADLEITDGVSNEVHEHFRSRADKNQNRHFRERKRQDVADEFLIRSRPSYTNNWEVRSVYKRNPTPNPKLSNLLRYSF
ncbi:MAG: putative RNA-binding protein [Gammaproteobacteria bacterium]|nr:MAG: putative RNA-binding protein [Gammaproteobacteria bacterium]